VKSAAAEFSKQRKELAESAEKSEKKLRDKNDKTAEELKTRKQAGPHPAPRTLPPRLTQLEPFDP
jgi:hypothetical protein